MIFRKESYLVGLELRTHLPRRDLGSGPGLGGTDEACSALVIVSGYHYIAVSARKNLPAHYSLTRRRHRRADRPTRCNLYFCVQPSFEIKGDGQGIQRIVLIL